MKILLVGNYLNDGIISMRLFADSLCEGLRSKGHEAAVIRPEALFGRMMTSGSGMGKWLGYLDKFFLFPARLKKSALEYDLIHVCDHSNAFYIRYLAGRPHLVTCHDLIAVRAALGEFPEYRTKWSGRCLQWMIKSGIKMSMHIVCVSENTRSDLLRLGGVDSGRVSLIYNGFNYSYETVDRVAGLRILIESGISIDSPFLLHVGGDKWYKNIKGALEIYSQLIRKEEFGNYKFLIVGNANHVYISRLIAEKGLEGRVVPIGMVDREKLRVLYSTAKGFIFPSLIEGFGWPIIEAQACGCPVFTTGKPPMTEVGGDAAIYIDSANPNMAAKIIGDALGSDEKVKEMKKAGFENIKRFSTKRMVDEYIALYSRLIESARPPSHPM